MNRYKILIAGDWHSAIHEEPLKKAFKTLGHTVEEFKWHFYLNQNGNNVFPKKVQKKFESYFGYGPTVKKINRDLIKKADLSRPDIIFIYRGNLISKSTITRIKDANRFCVVVSYNNDNPFSKYYRWYTWARFKKAISAYDLIFSYRPSNVEDYKRHGADKVCMLPPWFVKELNYPVDLDEREYKQYASDVVFIGHYEDDGRIELIRKLVNADIKVALYGPDWDKHIKADKDLCRLYPVRYLNGEEYNKALCASKIALVIYSKLNNDVYTRRCFEIPAARTLMLAKRTAEMESFYGDGKEAVFFDSGDDLVSKAKSLIENDQERQQIALNGCHRVHSSGHDVVSRAKKIITDIEECSLKISALEFGQIALK